jgi:hypothetical protein
MGWDDWEENLEYEDNPEETEERLQMEAEVPDVVWKDRIPEIKDPEARAEAIERAGKSLERWDELNEKFDSGEIDEYGHWAKSQKLIKQDTSDAVSSDLASVDLDPQKLGRLSDEYDTLLSADPKWIELNDRLNKVVDRDPEAAQELADRMFGEGRLSQEAYDHISEKTGRKR